MDEIATCLECGGGIDLDNFISIVLDGRPVWMHPGECLDKLERRLLGDTFRRLGG